MHRKVAVGLLIAASLIIGASFIYNYSQSSPTNEEAALKQARGFQAKSDCAKTPTTAVHIATNTKFDFPTSCLPHGWVSQQ